MTTDSADTRGPALGLKLRDRVTGLAGICTGRIEYLNGCVQYLVKPPIGKDGKVLDGDWVDSAQVEVVGDGLTVKRRNTGGPNPDAPRM